MADPDHLRPTGQPRGRAGRLGLAGLGWLSFYGSGLAWFGFFRGDLVPIWLGWLASGLILVRLWLGLILT